MSAFDFDLAVVGGGPAGAAAALVAARAGLAVALFEPLAMPGDKPCGEGILPAGVDALRALGLGELVARGRALTRIRYVLARGEVLEIDLPRPGCALERSVLERALDAALAAETRVTRRAWRAETERSAAGFSVRCAEGSVLARTLVAADGLHGDAASWLRRPRKSAARYGLRARARAARVLESVEVHLGRTSEVYLTPLPDERINVAVLRAALPEGERSPRAWLAAALAEHPRAAASLGEWITAPEARALSRPAPRRHAQDGAFLAGDAAGGVDPVLGCGVALALRTGSAAGRAAARVMSSGSGSVEREYERFVRREIRLRRTVAESLVFLAAHPLLQRGVARTFRALPALGRSLAVAVAGGSVVGRSGDP